MIKIYIQPNCANCKLLKTLFNNKKIKYEEIFDNEYLIKNGFKSTPIVNDGEFLNFIDAYTKYKNYKGEM